MSTFVILGSTYPPPPSTPPRDEGVIEQLVDATRAAQESLGMSDTNPKAVLGLALALGLGLILVVIIRIVFSLCTAASKTSKRAGEGSAPL